MNDIYGNALPILEGHEKALVVLGLWIFFGFLILAALRQWDEWQEKKNNPDPYTDDNNLGSH